MGEGQMNSSIVSPTRSACRNGRSVTTNTSVWWSLPGAPHRASGSTHRATSTSSAW